jgi:hypothetical protein
MKNNFILFFCLTVLLFIFGCKNDYPTSVYDPNNQSSSQPVITSLSPSDYSFAAVGDIIINGQNFSSVPGENFVYFDKTQVIPYYASPTQLKVTAPNVVTDSAKIVVVVKGAALMSDPPVILKLKPSFIVYSDFGDLDDPVGLDMDNNENLYVALNILGANCQVVKVTPDGVRNAFGTTGTAFGNALKVGPDDGVYLTRNLSTRIYTIPKTGGAAVTYAVLNKTALDLDFDKNGNLWVACEGVISRIKPDKSFIDFPIGANLRAIRVYNDYLYYAGVTNDTVRSQMIWRSKIISDNELGQREDVLNWGTKYWNPGKLAFTLTFSKDGDMYIGTDGADGIVVLKADGTFKPLYPGYIIPTGYQFAWGASNSSNYLFVTRRSPLDRTKQRIMEIYMGKEGAPYYGRK